METISFALYPGFETSGTIPSRGSSSAAGFDMSVICPVPVTIPAFGYHAFDTGIACAIPKGWCGLMCSRSSTFKVAFVSGVIDADYRGHVKLCVKAGPEPITVDGSKPIAQMVIIPHLYTAETVSYDMLLSTERGTGGFGSTGAQDFKRQRCSAD